MCYLGNRLQFALLVDLLLMQSFRHSMTTLICLSVPCTVTGRSSGQGPAILMIAVALICLLVLLLPLEGESSEWPSYIHATVNQKLIAAFALGTDTHLYNTPNHTSEPRVPLLCIK